MDPFDSTDLKKFMQTYGRVLVEWRQLLKDIYKVDIDELVSRIQKEIDCLFNIKPIDYRLIGECAAFLRTLDIPCAYNDSLKKLSESISLKYQKDNDTDIELITSFFGNQVTYIAELFPSDNIKDDLYQLKASEIKNTILEYAFALECNLKKSEKVDFINAYAHECVLIINTLSNYEENQHLSNNLKVFFKKAIYNFYDIYLNSEILYLSKSIELALTNDVENLDLNLSSSANDVIIIFEHVIERMKNNEAKYLFSKIEKLLISTISDQYLKIILKNNGSNSKMSNRKVQIMLNNNYVVIMHLLKNIKSEPVDSVLEDFEKYLSEYITLSISQIEFKNQLIVNTIVREFKDKTKYLIRDLYNICRSILLKALEISMLYNLEESDYFAILKGVRRQLE